MIPHGARPPEGYTASLSLIFKGVEGFDSPPVIENQLKEKHIARLSQGTRESIETSSVHLDLLAHLRQINGYIGNIADAVVKTKVLQSHESLTTG